VSYDSDKNVDFSQFKTYSILPIKEDSSTHVNQLDANTMISALKAEMASRDLEFVDSGADIMMSIYITVQNKEDINAYTDYMGGYGYGMGFGYGMGMGIGMDAGMGMANTTYEEDDYQESTVIIDCFLESTKKLIWEGTYKGEVKSKAQKRDKTIPKHMHAVMKNFPIKEIKN
jgi:hypothetical protein